MTIFRLFLITAFGVIAVYTAIVISSHGWNLLPVFFGDIGSLNWSGQFNLDFLGFLVMSGLWVAWRHEFSPAGIALGLAGAFGGMLFMSAYLFVVSIKAGGNIEALLLGRHARGAI
ncbi:MAG: hypothetical protein DI543_00070 [Bradyrhizobium icense]|jgi:hypothetical protein|nr:MAG: hypothetical protein DI543_00070 [Bradyrhizobium icense]